MQLTANDHHKASGASRSNCSVAVFYANSNWEQGPYAKYWRMFFLLLWVQWVTRSKAEFASFVKRQVIRKATLYTILLFNPSVPKVRSPNLQREMYKWGSENLAVWSSFIWVNYEKFFQRCDVIFLVRLQGKFEVDHSWKWIGLLHRV